MSRPKYKKWTCAVTWVTLTQELYLNHFGQERKEEKREYRPYNESQKEKERSTKLRPHAHAVNAATFSYFPLRCFMRSCTREGKAPPTFLITSSAKLWGATERTFLMGGALHTRSIVASSGFFLLTPAQQLWARTCIFLWQPKYFVRVQRVCSFFGV